MSRWYIGQMFGITATSTLIPSSSWRTMTKSTVGYHLSFLLSPLLSLFLAFVLTVYEISATISSLWNHVKGSLPNQSKCVFVSLPPPDFIKKNPEFVTSNNSMGFISDSGGATYNRCHCWVFSFSPHLMCWIWQPDWSNFEIADMDFWRGPAYTAFFDHLDSTGGFYYEVLYLFLCIQRLR